MPNNEQDKYAALLNEVQRLREELENQEEKIASLEEEVSSLKEEQEDKLFDLRQCLRDYAYNTAREFYDRAQSDISWYCRCR